MRVSFKKVGALYHWRIGRIGGSFYIAKRKPKPQVINFNLLGVSNDRIAMVLRDKREF